MSLVSRADWEQFLAGEPEAHLLQTGAWGELKSQFGWRASWLVEGNCGAQVLFRKLPLGFSVAYIPKGPVGKPSRAFWSQVDALCRRQHAVFLKVEPDQWEEDQASVVLEGAPFIPSTSIQPRRTIVIDLAAGDEAILAQMKQKTRYNLRLAQKRGVRVCASEDVESFYRLMQTTGERDEFGIHTLSYYQKSLELFRPRSECELFLAAWEGEMIAGLMVFRRGPRAWYFYGASGSAHRELMAPYGLQWEAMQWARAQGASTYDLWGVPDYGQEVLEAEFMDHTHQLWGVYRFKRGFGGELKRSAGAWDRVYQPWLYRLLLRMGRKDG